MTEWQITIVCGLSLLSGYLFGLAQGCFDMADCIRRQREGGGND